MITQLSPDELIHLASQIPAVPDGVHLFGQAIEQAKVMVFSINRCASELKDIAERKRKAYASLVRDGKATLNEADKELVAEQCASDESLLTVERQIRELTELGARWDARRSRLEKDFSVLLADYIHVCQTVEAGLNSGEPRPQIQLQANAR